MSFFAGALIVSNALHSIMLIALLFYRRARRNSKNYWLAAFVIFFSLSGIFDLLESLTAGGTLLIIAIANTAAIAMITPTCIGYFESIFRASPSSKRLILYHAGVSVIIIMIGLPAVFGFILSKESAFEESVLPDKDFWDVINIIRIQLALSVFHQGLALILTFIRIKKYYLFINDSGRWALFLFFGIFIGWIFFLLNSFFSMYFGMEYFSSISLVIYSCVFYAMTFIGLLQPKVFLHRYWQPQRGEKHPLVAEAFRNEKRYRKSALTADQMALILLKLDREMSAQPLWRDPDLTLQGLADYLCIRRDYLSQSLNVARGENFSEYLNRLRIKDAQQLILSPEDKSILDIAYLVGYNSKSSFNSAFKRITGRSPSAWRGEQAGSPVNIGQA